MTFNAKNTVKGTTYVYESVGTWDKEKKQTRHKRVCIGKLDPVTGELIPSKRLSKPTTCREYGNFYFLNEISQKCGMTNILKSVFSKTWKEILTCAFFEVSEKKAMYLCEEWNDLCITPSEKSITSQRISELFKEISIDDRMNFFKKWGNVRAEQEYIAFDITSISSYSKLIEYVEMGYNRDSEDLPQINLGMLFGETSLLPIYYNIYPGSIRDVSTLANMLELLKFLDMKGIKFVMDKGFFSTSNIDSMICRGSGYKFSIAVPFTAGFAKEAVDFVRGEISLPSNTLLINNQIVQGVTYQHKWKGKNIYVHVIFNQDKYNSEEKNFLKKIITLEQEILSDNRVESHEKQYKMYFSVRKTRTGKRVDRINEKIIDSLKYKGFCVIISNDIKYTDEIIETYRNKDVVEKSFDNLKNELDLNRLRIHSDKAMEGRVFIAFLSLILQSHIHRIMKKENLYDRFTKEQLICEMKKIKKVEFADSNKNFVTEISKNQREIFEAFEISLPKY